MKSKFVSRIAASFLVVLPAVASSACAMPEVAAYAAAESYAQQTVSDAKACRSARETAEFVHQMQITDGVVPQPIPVDCARGAGATKQGEVVRDEKVRAAGLARPQ